MVSAAARMAAAVPLGDRRLFVSMPGQGEAELFAIAPLQFTVKSQGGVTVQFQSAADGAVTGVEVTIGPQKLIGKRQTP